jgi:DNA (cytosine-5)-methyltransferase 1
MTLTVGSLFSGIGGLDLGLERAGMNVIWQSEIDPYACRVLSKHWPEVPNHGDIKAIKWGDVVRPDVICGGYPCQPFSLTGHRKGEQDERHLWPWVKDAISELRPKYAILENVRGHLSMGGLSVIGDLASIGYDAEWRVISASSVGAPHRRDRIVIVGYPHSKPKTQRKLDGTSPIPMECMGDASWLRAFRWPTNQPGMVGVANGVSNGMDRRRGLGNAVVPQVAEVIGRLVISHAQHN